MSKHFVRSIKNITNRYTSTEITVRNATSNEPWGPSISELHEIAVLTYHDKYVKEVLDILEKRLNDKGKNWRHVMKALTILLHCIYEGSDTVVEWLKRNLYLVKTLREFRYADERNIDQGAPIRAKAKQITGMIESPEKLAQEKQQYKALRENMGRPGIVDLATGSAAPVKSRLTLDLSSTGRPRTSNGGGNSANSISGGAGSSSLYSPALGTSPGGSVTSMTSPRSSLDTWAQQSSSAAYRTQQKVRAPKSSMEGRYSLSLPLHSIQEESQNNGSSLRGANSISKPSGPGILKTKKSITALSAPVKGASVKIVEATESEVAASMISPTANSPQRNGNQAISVNTAAAAAYSDNTGAAPVSSSLASPIGSNNPFFNMVNSNPASPVVYTVSQPIAIGISNSNASAFSAGSLGHNDPTLQYSSSSGSASFASPIYPAFEHQAAPIPVAVVGTPGPSPVYTLASQPVYANPAPPGIIDKQNVNGHPQAISSHTHAG